MTRKEQPKKEPIKVQQLRPPKLKDKTNRSRIIMNLKAVFGFMPEIIIIDKVPNENNKIIISAVLPRELAEREENADNKSNKDSKSEPKPSKD